MKLLPALSPARGFTLFYFAQFLFLGVQLPFFPGWLDEVGFSGMAIGLITGGSLILRLLLGPVLAWWAESQTDQRVVLWLLTGGMCLSASLMLIGEPAWAVAALAVTAMWCFGCLVPLTDTAVVRAEHRGHLDYGQARAAGSIAFILANLGGGILIARTAEVASVWWMAGAAGLSFAVALFLPREAAAAVETDEEGHSRLSPQPAEALRLVRSKSFLLMLAASGLTQGAHAVYYAFSKLHWSQLGYGSDLIGVLWTLGVVAEVAILYLGRSLLARFGPVWLIAAGALAAFIRWPLTGLSPALPVLALLQLLHAFTFATAFLGAVNFIGRAVPANLANTGMTLVSTLGIGAVTGLATIVAGLFFDPANPFPAYAMMGAMGGLGFLAALGLMRHWDGGVIRAAREDSAQR